MWFGSGGGTCRADGSGSAEKVRGAKNSEKAERLPEWREPFAMDAMFGRLVAAAELGKQSKNLDVEPDEGDEQAEG